MRTAVGDEATTLRGSLERQRATFEWKCADLTHEALYRLCREAIDGRVGEDPPGPAAPFSRPEPAPTGNP